MRPWQVQIRQRSSTWKWLIYFLSEEECLSFSFCRGKRPIHYQWLEYQKNDYSISNRISYLVSICQTVSGQIGRKHHSVGIHMFRLSANLQTQPICRVKMGVRQTATSNLAHSRPFSLFPLFFFFICSHQSYAFVQTIERLNGGCRCMCGQMRFCRDVGGYCLDASVNISEVKLAQSSWRCSESDHATMLNRVHDS